MSSATGLTGIILGQSQRVTIAQGGPAVVTFDASVVEEHTQTATVTTFPVEEGADISDHIRVDPVSLTMTGIVSNTPIIPLATLLTGAGVGVPGAPGLSRAARSLRLAEEAYEALLQLQGSGELVEVTTTLRTYNNMALTSISVPRDAGRGNIMEASLTFQEVRIASAELITARDPVDPARGDQSDAGTNAPKAATPQQASKAAGAVSRNSWPYDAGETIKKFFFGVSGTP